MKKIAFAFLMGLSLYVNNGDYIYAKETSAVTKQKSKGRELIENLPVRPFDINSESLLPNYSGVDIAKLFLQFSKSASLRKGEFESTEDFNKKAALTVSDDIYAFKIQEKLGRGSLSVSSYDADKQQFQIVLETEAVDQFVFKDYRASLIVKTVNEQLESYIGSNAYGAMREVTRYTATQYGLALVNEVDFGKNRYSLTSKKSILDGIRDISLVIEIPPEKAKTLKNNVGVLLLIKPALNKSRVNPLNVNQGNDLIFESSKYLPATIDAPSSHSYNRKFINAEIIEIWIYDIKKGEVILKRKSRENDKK